MNNPENAQKTQQNRYIACNIGVVCGAIVPLATGIDLQSKSLKLQSLAQEAKGWPSTVGKITELNPEHHPNGVTCTINYTVDGHKFIYQRSWQDIGWGWVTPHDNAVSRFMTSRKIGDMVAVFYRPADPEVSIIVPETNEPPVTFLYSGWTLAIVAAALLISGIFRLLTIKKKTFPIKKVSQSLFWTTLIALSAACLTALGSFFFGGLLTLVIALILHSKGY